MSGEFESPALTSGKMTRRAFLRRAGALGILATGAGTLLAACGGSSTSNTTATSSASGATSSAGGAASATPAAGSSASPAAGMGTPGSSAATPVAELDYGDLGGDLVVCVAGGAWEDAYRANMDEPFKDKYAKVKTNLDLTSGTAQLAKLRAAKGNNPPFDEVLILDEEMDIAVREGLIEPFDASEVPYVTQLYSVSAPEKWQKDGKYYAVHQNWGQLGLTYRTDKIQNPPKDWLDVWKPEYKGLLGMPPISYSVGLQFFIATVHALGGDEANEADVDKAFEKMKELKPNIAQQPADAGSIQQLLERGDIALVPLWDGRAFGLAASGLPIGFIYPDNPGPVASGSPIGIAKGTKNRKAALAMLNFRLGAEPQKGFCQQMWYGPSNKNVTLDPKYQEKVHYGDEAYEKLLTPNYDVVSQKLGTWSQRWASIFGG